MIDDSQSTNEVPNRLFELVQQGAVYFRATWNRKTVLFTLYAVVLATMAMFEPSLVPQALLFAGAVVFVFFAIGFQVTLSFGPMNELGSALRSRQIVWVTHFPEKRGYKNLLLISAPTKRWTVRLHLSEANEMLALLPRYDSSIHVEPYDGSRFRQWIRNPEAPPWT